MRCDRRGVTLVEMLVVMTILGLMAGIAYPSVTRGLDSLRLSTAADDAAALLAQAANHAQRKQEWVEVRVTPHRLELNGKTLTRELALSNVEAAPEQSIFIDPLGAIPAASIELRNANGKRVLRIDPITGAPEVRVAE
jgi:prepilin-type N-terminal cleavage/methylation domain-containing protein